MNPWELLFTILGWMAVGVALMGAFIVVFGVIYGIARVCGAKWAQDSTNHKN